MYLQELKLNHYKNHTDTKLKFRSGVNVFVGNNGEGKTNLLDAIHIACYGRSYFSNREVHIKQYDASFYRVEARIIQKNMPEKVVVKYDGQAKTIEVDGVAIAGLVDFLGRYPVTMISPGDIELVHGGSEVRRKFLDQILSQTDRAYLESLIQYSRVLKQRNTFLKNPYNEKSARILIESWNGQLTEHGVVIYQARVKFMELLNEHFNEQYRKISDDKDVILLKYRSQLQKQSFADGMATSWEKDKILKRTNFGIHKDDLSLEKDDFLISRVASQGQIKSTVLALKLAQLTYLKSHLKSSPILLLDDIFDKLDPNRIKNLLLELVTHQKCQVFITDAFKNRLSDLLDEIIPDEYDTWIIEDGHASKINNHE